ncbi:hypothetical protein K3U94_14895 [Mycolicibacter heraklionensis]|uniref:Uncharacterized protein n=1 Tax=Mycolicibacter heraklionensis TaxID=512402 RepID=A0A9X7WDM3_9MYCO|nr:hypothetical protein [Mycolicibacter heraklionensis]QZA06315.1 hypothetical protein K3U94_14895 [Mycolicibacter heraklionensis]
MPNGAARTPAEIAAVSAHLEAKGGIWTAMPPDYTDFSRDQLLKNLSDVAIAVGMETDADPAAISRAHEKNQDFVERSFDYFEGTRTVGRPIARAFCVPMRSSRHDQANASESTPFTPLLDPVRFGVDSDKRMRGMYGLPPTVLDTYTRSSLDEESGALVLVPMYSDMLTDLWPDRSDAQQAVAMATAAAFVLKETTLFAHHRLGAKVLGLGAILPHPTITNFGQRLREFDGMADLVTTTGHGGTVSMIVETVKKVMYETRTESFGRIGVIGGAGSIGMSATVALLHAFDDYIIHSHDRRHLDLSAHEAMRDRVTIEDSSAEVLRATNIIVTAVTGSIDLDNEEYDGIDLTGKVIIDDSQPGCFDKEQVEERGGKLLWVVGEDGSDSHFITRDGLYTDGTPYNYGNTSGLYGFHAEFACGQEAAVIAKYGAYDRAIAGPVTPESAQRISTLFSEAGVRVAPFQAYGQPVSFD